MKYFMSEAKDEEPNSVELSDKATDDEPAKKKPLEVLWKECHCFYVSYFFRALLNILGGLVQHSS